VSSVRYLYSVARLTPRYLAMSLPVCPSAFIRFAVAMWSASSTLRGRPNLVPFAREVWRLSAVRSLPDSPPRVPCPLGGPGPVVRMGRPPDSRPLHIPAPDPGPLQTRQCPVEDLRLRAESPLAVSGLGRPA
jgi:hypothetical protein